MLGSLGLKRGIRLRVGTEDDAWQADKSKMTEMFSQQAEKVTFERPVEVKGAPAHYLTWPYMPVSPAFAAYAITYTAAPTLKLCICRTLRQLICACRLDTAGRRVEGEAAGAGMVEGWLAKVVDGMQGTMKAIIKRANRNVNEMKLDEFLFSHPAQVALLGLQFQWTADTQVSRPLSWWARPLVECL